MAAIMLSACGTKNEAETVDLTETDDWVIVEEEADAEAEADTVSDVEERTEAVLSSDMEETEIPEETAPTGDYREIYTWIVEEKGGDSLTFALIYLDEDDMPELVIWDHYYLTYSVYTVKDGKSFCLIDSMATVALEYYEYSGIVSAFARWNGGGDQGSYSSCYYQVSGDKTITDDDEPMMYYIYDAVYDEEGKWTGGGVTQYYYMGQEIDEAAYEKMEDELGIEIDNRKSFGNSYERAEMLELLPKLPAIPGIYDSDAAREAYDSVLETLYTTYTLPDGTDLSYDGVLDLSDNSFAICDVDQDGQEELIIIWESTYTVRQSVIVYGYDSETETVRAELWQYPLQTFYDNGIVEVGLSHNQGLAREMPDNMDFWPYFLYQYDKVSDTYMEIALVDAWNKAFMETDYNGNAFPDDIDVDGDGVVYMITNEGYERTVDGEAYQTWRDSFIGGASAMEIPFENMTESHDTGA